MLEFQPKDALSRQYGALCQKLENMFGLQSKGRGRQVARAQSYCVKPCHHGRLEDALCTLDHASAGQEERLLEACRKAYIEQVQTESTESGSDRVDRVSRICRVAPGCD